MELIEYFGESLWALHKAYIPLVLARARECVEERKQPRAAYGSHDQSMPQAATINGVCVIPLIGALTARGDMGTVSTMRTENMFRDAIRNAGVKSILLDVDSPGGAVFNTDQLCRAIYESRGKKPIIAHVNGTMASAALWIGTAADQVYASPDAEVGSVGVWMAHQDMSGALEQAGIRVSIISAGEHKLEGSELGPLSEETRKHLQQRVDEMNDSFEHALARNRGVSVSVIRKDYGNGRVFGAKEALRRGMVDGVRPIQQTLSAMVSGRSPGGARAAIRPARPLSSGTGGGDPDLLRRKLKLKEAEQRIAASADCPAVRCDQAPPNGESVRWYNAMFGRSQRCW